MVSSSLPTMLQALANALIIFMTCVNTILTSFCTKRTHKWCCQIHPIILSNSSYDMALVPAAWSLGCLTSWCHTLSHGRLGLGIISDALVLASSRMPWSCCGSTARCLSLVGRAFQFTIWIDFICYANRFVLWKKSAFRFTSCHAVSLAYLLYSLSQKISWRHYFRTSTKTVTQCIL